MEDLMLQMYFQKGMQSLFFMGTALSLLSFIMVCWPNSKADCLWGRQRKRKHLLKKQRGTEMEMFKKKKVSWATSNVYLGCWTCFSVPKPHQEISQTRLVTSRDLPRFFEMSK